ncbi:hypothetical protein [Chitinophaga sp. OAE865]|uniref:hypothetical protein n=1 Tax=Chitinophaga sp. OAE865 TaxID=2817898 RepID=UPI001AE9971A
MPSEDSNIENDQVEKNDRPKMRHLLHAESRFSFSGFTIYTKRQAKTAQAVHLNKGWQSAGTVIVS